MLNPHHNTTISVQAPPTDITVEHIETGVYLTSPNTVDYYFNGKLFRLSEPYEPIEIPIHHGDSVTGSYTCPNDFKVMSEADLISYLIKNHNKAVEIGEE